MNKSWRGFTLLEMLLVIVIASSILYMALGYIQQRTLMAQVSRTSQQMQQILNAGLAFYVNNQSWPTSIAALQSGGYLPITTIVSPFNTSYSLSSSAQLLTVSITLPTMSNQSAVAQIIAGKLPLSSVSGATVNAFVNIPGQSLNSATAMSFAGLYHHGACIPTPNCIAGTTPQIFIIPVSVSGVYDDTYNYSSTMNVYPLSSFTAYATGPFTNGASNQCAGGGGADCGTSSTSWWRACLQVTTEKGSLAGRGAGGSIATWWGQYVTLAAFVRCAATNEPSGSSFGVYSL